MHQLGCTVKTYGNPKSLSFGRKYLSGEVLSPVFGIIWNIYRIIPEKRNRSGIMSSREFKVNKVHIEQFWGIVGKPCGLH